MSNREVVPNVFYLQWQKQDFWNSVVNYFIGLVFQLYALRIWIVYLQYIGRPT